MVTTELAAIAERHDGAQALSAYISVPPGTADPAAYARIALRNGVTAAHEALVTASHVERTAFEACAIRLMNALANTRGGLSGCTWAAFAIADGATYHLVVSALLPTRTQSRVAWDSGICVAPYHALDALTTATVVLVDRENAVFLSLDGDDLQETARFHTKAKIEVGPHMSGPPQISFHIGTRGATAKDVAERQATSAAARHRARVVSELSVANEHRPVYVGGAADVAMHVVAALPNDSRERAVIVPGLHCSSTVPEIRSAVRAADQRQRAAAALAAVESTLASAHSSRLGVLGEGPVAAALAQRAVARLVVAAPLLDSAPERVERMVRDAQAQNADIRIVQGAAAAQLEAEAAGVGAKLRFPIVDLWHHASGIRA